jgi:hypothetical protein
MAAEQKAAARCRAVGRGRPRRPCLRMADLMPAGGWAQQFLPSVESHAVQCQSQASPV